ncbi:MAG: hypothetical protein IJJ44_04510 [Solobacterium sp.]|nr:hypothetical protein [Solobacterium sp.]
MNLKPSRTIIDISLMHAMIDFLCALAMFGRYSLLSSAMIYIVYNFCAFALQMPLGILTDLMTSEHKVKYQYPALSLMCLGVVLTILGIYTRIWILGVGNALFHVGGGMISIFEDDARKMHGSGLGLFVAPGAVGLTFGTMLGKQHVLSAALPVILVLCVTAVLVSLRILRSPVETPYNPAHTVFDERLLKIIAGCFVVVVLRSYIGLNTGFSWRDTTAEILLCTLAVASGKYFGGLLSALYGIRKITVLSLSVSTAAYLLSGIPVFGILALLSFNMTMPITLYILKCEMLDMPGFAFGILTFGLFLGYYLHITFPEVLYSSWIASAGSILSVIILLYVLSLKRSHEE